jgi:hypothetical protein
MFNSRKYYFFIFIILAFSGCKKDVVDFPVEPKIEFVFFVPQTAKQFSDHVKITFRYEDGDGDLGENKNDVKNCFVTDSRLGITYEFRIPQRAPTGTNVPIKGSIEVDLGGQIITDSTSSQSVTYTMYVVDRAGHKSSTITTGAVTLVE